jgi:hypothetical protein
VVLARVCAGGDFFDDLGGADNGCAVDEMVLDDATWLGAAPHAQVGATVVDELHHERMQGRHALEVHVVGVALGGRAASTSRSSP